MAAQVTYEVYFYDGSRWSLQETFRGHQKQRALDAAQELYAEADIKGIRVMEESYDPDSGQSNQKTLLKRTKTDDVPALMDRGARAGDGPSRKAPSVASRPVPGAPVLKDAKAAAAAKARAAGAAADNARASRVFREPPRPVQLITLVLGGGALAAAAGIVFVLQSPQDVGLVPSLKATFGPYWLLTVAGAMFAVGLCAGGLILIAEGSARTFLYDVAPPRPATGTVASAPPPARTTSPSTPKLPTVEVEEDEELDPSAGIASAPPEATQLVAFFQQSLASLTKRPDAQALFGCYLFLAGLCTSEARRGLWDQKMTRDVMAAALSALVGDPKAGARFAARYEEFLTDPKSQAMFEAGQAAADARAQGSVTASATLANALDEWAQKEQDAAAITNHVAVMFTDIIGSTEFTQIHGDAKHYEMVQAHNRIVRDALQAFSGREIKHTGDGIMAAFDDARLAVQATQQIHRNINAHRSVNAEIGMTLRIGLAAGEPIKAGSDLFGSTVQLASRMCAIAGDNQTACSEAVKQICEGTGYQFADLGEKQLKGFKTPVKAYAITDL